MIFSKSNNYNQTFTNKSALSKLSAVGLAICLLVTGCGKADETVASVDKAENEQASEQALANHDEAAGNNADTNAKVDPNRAQKPAGRPVSYDIQNWEASKNQDLTLDDLDQIKKQFGKVTITDDKSLDYASNMAVKYRFMEGEQPYLDIIDSDNYIEFGWYYANPNDSDSEKKLSISHAKKVYKVMTGLMGEEGGNLVSSILSKKIVKNQVIGDQKVELAKCEFYSCMIILDKNS